MAVLYTQRMGFMNDHADTDEIIKFAIWSVACEMYGHSVQKSEMTGYWDNLPQDSELPSAAQIKDTADIIIRHGYYIKEGSQKSCVKPVWKRALMHLGETADPHWYRWFDIRMSYLMAIHEAVFEGKTVDFCPNLRTIRNFVGVLNQVGADCSLQLAQTIKQVHEQGVRGR